MPIACITGITGQTGSYLAHLLINEGFTVYGMIRRSSNFNTQRIDDIFHHENLKLIYGDLSDYSSVVSLVSTAKPDLFFNLGAQSHVRVSFDVPEYTFDIDATGVLRCLEAIRHFSPHTRFLTASSSEMFGSTPPPQNERTPFHPRSPYAVAKVAGYYATVNYREAYGLFAANAISFNHESSMRGETFVTRKITRAATRIKLGMQKELLLGNLEARRDWSHAADVARAMHMIMCAPEPDDYCIGSGRMYSVQDLVEYVFSHLGLDWEQHVFQDDRYLRPSEVDALCCDNSKICARLGWEPRYSFEELVTEMIDHDMDLARQEKLLSEHGHRGPGR